MVNNIERIMARRQVDAEIKADPSLVIPRRKIKIATVDGGHKWSLPAPVTSTPYQVLIMPAKRRLSDMTINTELGDLVKYPFILLARHTASFERDDVFEWRGDDFVVKTVSIKTEVSLTVQIDYFGGDHNG